MTRYHYVTVPVETVIDLARLCTEPDSYIAEDEETRQVLAILRKGYRWIRSEDGLAIFEKGIEVVKRAKWPPTQK
jgi:hypothetical protein